MMMMTTMMMFQQWPTHSGGHSLHSGLDSRSWRRVWDLSRPDLEHTPTLLSDNHTQHCHQHHQHCQHQHQHHQHHIIISIKSVQYIMWTSLGFFYKNNFVTTVRQLQLASLDTTQETIFPPKMSRFLTSLTTYTHLGIVALVTTNLQRLPVDGPSPW